MDETYKPGWLLATTLIVAMIAVIGGMGWLFTEALLHVLSLEHPQ